MDDNEKGPQEERLRARLRAVAGSTLLILVAILSLADTFGRGADLHASEFIFGSLLGALLLTLGIEAGARIIRK